MDPDIGAYEPATRPRQCSATSPENDRIRCARPEGHDDPHHMAVIPQEGYRQVTWTEREDETVEVEHQL